MMYEAFWEEIGAYLKPTGRLVLEDGDPGQVPITKIGGVPWWPEGAARPKCDEGHLMSFMAQIRLSDVPGFPPTDGGLLSFHYCQECASEGNASWGLSDDDSTGRGYDLTIFEDLAGVQPDGIGIVAEDVLGPHTVSLSHREETPGLEDIWEIEELDALLPESDDEEDDELMCILSDPFEFDEEDYPDFIHIPTSKLGGWPSWAQSPEWPEYEGERGVFVCQLDAVLGENASWGGGGYAYLFVTPEGVTPRSAEFLMQAT